MSYKHAAIFFSRNIAEDVLKLLKHTGDMEYTAAVISTSEHIYIKVDPSSYYNYYMQVSQNQTGSYSQAEFVGDVNENIRFFIPSDDSFNTMLQQGICSEHQQFEVWLEEEYIYDYAGIKDAADYAPSKNEAAFKFTLAKILEDLNQDQS